MGSTGIPIPRGPRMIAIVALIRFKFGKLNPDGWQPHPECGVVDPPQKKKRVWPTTINIKEKKKRSQRAWMVIFNFTKELCACFTGKRQGGWEMDPRGRPAVKWKSGWEEKIWEWPKSCYFSIGILSKSGNFGEKTLAVLFLRSFWPWEWKLL